MNREVVAEAYANALSFATRPGRTVWALEWSFGVL
jgi:hypothetical protein